jgi:molybdate transport system substrate-binding protein
MKRSVVVTALFLLAACSSNSTGPSLPASSGTGGGQLTVFAASSLTAAFDEIGWRFESANPGTTMTFNYGSSTDLATQIQSEGTADVFASASGTAMETVESDPGVTDRTDFATNELVVIVPTDNPAGIASLDDLGNDGVQVVLGAKDVPVGDYAREMLDNAGLTDQVMANVVSNEPDDASIVAKVESGEADAGIVYTSDIAAAEGGVDSVEVPADVNVTATYPIATVNGSAMAHAAAAFVEYVTGGDGQAVLKQYGFGPPPS